jgi:hypothetical protein
VGDEPQLEKPEVHLEKASTLFLREIDTV